MSDDRIQPERPDSRRPPQKKPADLEGIQADGPDELPSFSRRQRRLAGDDTDEAGADVSELQQLGSLAQSARGKHLRQARNTLLTVGILMGLLQTGMFIVDNNQTTQEIRKTTNDPVQRKNAEMAATVFLVFFHGAAIVVAAIFVVLAFFVEKFPVPTTVIALVLFLGLQVVFAVINPLNLAAGWIIKIVVIVALVKAMQAGLAAKKDERRIADAEYE
jgi:hypothetical protein